MQPRHSPQPGNWFGRPPGHPSRPTRTDPSRATSTPGSWTPDPPPLIGTSVFVGAMLQPHLAFLNGDASDRCVRPFFDAPASRVIAAAYGRDGPLAILWPWTSASMAHTTSVRAHRACVRLAHPVRSDA